MVTNYKLINYFPPQANGTLDSFIITNHGQNYSSQPSLISNSPLCSCNGASGSIPGPMDDCITARVALGAILQAKRALGAVFIGNVARGAIIKARIPQPATVNAKSATGASLVRF
jgi:hypothetical protein